MTQNETFDYKRVKEWALSRPRKPAVLSFTSGVERDVAYLIEDLDSQPRTITREELHYAGEAIWRRLDPDDKIGTMGIMPLRFVDAAEKALATLGITVEG